MGKSKICRRTLNSSNNSKSKSEEKDRDYSDKCSNENIQQVVNENEVQEVGFSNMDVACKDMAPRVSVFKLFSSCWTSPDSQTPDSHTGYADALKKNLSAQDDLEIIEDTISTNVSIDQLETLKKDDSLLSHMQLTNKEASINEICSSIWPKIDQTSTDEENARNLPESSTNYLTNTITDTFNLGSLVSNSTTTLKSTSKSICDEWYHLDESIKERSLPFDIDDINPSNPKPNCKRLHRSKSSSFEKTLKKDSSLRTEFKKVAKDDASLKDKSRTSKNTTEKLSKILVNNVDYKDGMRRQTIAYKFLNSVHHVRSISERNTSNADPMVNESSRRTYSDVTRVENNSENVKSLPKKDVKEKVQRRYSDVTRAGLNQTVEINTKNNDATQKSLPGKFGRDELEDELSDCELLNILNNCDTTTGIRDSQENLSKEICQNVCSKEERINEFDYEHDFEKEEVLDNQSSVRLKQEKYFDDSQPCADRSLVLIKNNDTGSINIDDYKTCMGRLNKYSLRKKMSRKVITKPSGKRNSLPRNLRLNKIALNHREILSKSPSNLQLSVPPDLSCSDFQQPEKKTMSNLISLCKDFEKRCSLSDGQLPTNNLDNFSSTRHNVSSSENDKENVGFFDNILKNLKLKTLKNNTSLSKIPNKHFENSKIEYERQNESKENALNNERKLAPETSLSTNHETTKENQSRSLDGNLFKFINCQSDSKWHSLLKQLQPCVPLSQLLLPPTEIPRCYQAMHLSSIHSMVGKVVFSTKLENTLREGAFGTFIGILETGKPVVVRQISSSATFKDIKALNILKSYLLAHKNLTILYDAQINLRDLTMSLIYELCEYSLPQYMQMRRSCESRTMVHPMFFRKLLVADLLEGIRYLHQMKVVHGFIKPSNIMVTIDERLKVTDYHLHSMAPFTWGIRVEDSKLSPIGSSISSYCWRPTELINAGNESEAQTCVTTASDIQMCGMLVFYILSDGQHPFGSTDRICQENIGLGNLSMGLHLVDIESRDLVCEMTKAEPADRPSMQDVLRHPYFWDKEKRFTFLLQVGRKITFYTSKPNREVEDFHRRCSEARNWTSNIHRDLMKFLCICTNKSFGNDFSELLEFAVALQIFFQAMPPCLKNIVKHPTHFILLKFPALFMSVFDVARRSPLLITQMGLQHYF